MEVGRLDLEEGNTCWYCGGCRARSAAAVGTRNAESFRSKHGRSCGVEITRIVRHAVEATPVSGPPCSIEGLIEEVQAARRDETLITPGLDFVAEVLSTVQRMDTSQMSGNAEKDRAAPWRKADWQAGVASAARKRRLPPREEACEICAGFESDHHNQLFVCDHTSADGQPCLRGAHAQCLARQRQPVPSSSESVGENWYCAEHRAQYS